MAANCLSVDFSVHCLTTANMPLWDGKERWEGGRRREEGREREREREREIEEGRGREREKREEEREGETQNVLIVALTGCYEYTH